MRTVLAADLGGTKCRYALVAEDLTVHAPVQVPTVHERDAFLRTLHDAVAGVLAAAPPGLERPGAMGLGVAGIVVPDGSRFVAGPNLPINDHPLVAEIGARYGLPAALVNDGRASAWGEYLTGHARGLDPLLCLFFGTGIGIGVMIGGQPHRGFANAAGEIGHTMFRPGVGRCPCGELGHFEAFCGGRPITERAAADLGAPPGERWTVGDVVAAAGREDATGARARAILELAEEAACVLTANLCTVLNPAAVVLGGGVLAGWPALRGRIEAWVRANTRPLIHDGLRFVPSLGGSDAILQGAAAATGWLVR